MSFIQKNRITPHLWIRPCRHGWLRTAFASVLAIAMGGFGANAFSAVQWPEEWVVFAPLTRSHEPLAPAQLRAVPEKLEWPAGGGFPALSLEPRKLAVTPGEAVDLADLLGEASVGATAYLFIPLHAEQAGTLTLGMGADWWLESWLNGEPLLDTLQAGNDAFPPSVLDHRTEATLHEGLNLLVIRFIRGAASALIAVGDASHLPAARERRTERREDRALNSRPEAFRDRLLFPETEQATATAAWTIDLTLPEVELTAGALTGLQPMPERQVFLHPLSDTRAEMRDTLQQVFEDPVALLLSKARYPFEDRHLDAIVWTTPPEGESLTGRLEIRLGDAGGDVLARHTVSALSPTGWCFSVGFPEQLAGQDAWLEAVWLDGDREIGRTRSAFRVDEPTGMAESGRVPLQVINEPGATVSGAPMTVGVPFPRGALLTDDVVRLVDKAGDELPLQTRVSARWSRYGFVKWLLCDFTVDLDGGPRELFLEYGRREAAPLAVGGGQLADAGNRASSPAPDERRWASMDVDSAHTGFPALNAGRLRFDADGLAVDVRGDGTFQPVLDAQALSGAFVVHENGRSYQPDPSAPFVIEESGPVKTVLRRKGWYVAVGSEHDARRTTHDARGGTAHRAGLQDAATAAPQNPHTHTPTHPHTSPFPTPNARFCNFVTRLVIHHDSPVVRIFHTWIFTGDGNRDRIAEMGWRFPTASVPEGGALLVSHEPATWSGASNLVQFDYQTFNLAEPGSEQPGRTPGVLSARVGDVGVHFGVKDFWQNFPSELAIDNDGFTFYNWPRHNPPAAFARPVPREEVFRHRFAHEGEVLDFRLPAEYAEGEIWREACALEGHWAEGRPETANAQGIARTEEMFLVFTPAETDRDAVALTLQGLNDESLRAVADPAWTASSGVFGDIHPRDTDRFAEDEHLYEQVVLAPGRWNEQLGFYGMWLHGDLPAWAMNLPERFVSLYRTIRKNHHGWPIRWIAWARSGDPRLLKPAEAITRQMIDANFCHYVDEAVDASVGPDHFRLQGWWDRSLLPWAARRGPSARTYTVDCDYLWQAYYLTGFTRARDVALLFGEATKNHFHAPTGPRTTASMLPSYLDMYEATWDPWFLLAAHTLARLHRHIRPHPELLDRFTDVSAHQVVADYWRPADEQFTRFTGCPAHLKLTLNQAIAYSSPHTYGFRHRWDFLSFPYITPAIFAWEQTGDRFYLERLAGYLDLMRRDVYDGEPDFYRGSLIQGGAIVSGYYIRQFPLALAALARAGEPWPTPIPDPFHVLGTQVPEADDNVYRFVLPEVIVRKETGVPLRIQLAHRFASRADGVFYAYTVYDPAGNPVLEGAWPLDTRLRSVEIPVEAPAGNYRIVYSGRAPLPADGRARARTIRNQGWVRLPATDPYVPEVLYFPGDEDGTEVAPGRPELVYHFQVPRGLESFWIAFGGGGRLNRVSVWNPDGDRVWDHCFTGGPGVRGGRVDIDVPPEHAGGIWRASGGTFTIDPRIPPYFSQTRQKWFDPASGTGDR